MAAAARAVGTATERWDEAVLGARQAGASWARHRWRGGDDPPSRSPALGGPVTVKGGGGASAGGGGGLGVRGDLAESRTPSSVKRH